MGGWHEIGGKEFGGLLLVRTKHTIPFVHPKLNILIIPYKLKMGVKRELVKVRFPNCSTCCGDFFSQWMDG